MVRGAVSLRSPNPAVPGFSSSDDSGTHAYEVTQLIGETIGDRSGVTITQLPMKPDQPVVHNGRTDLARHRHRLSCNRDRFIRFTLSEPDPREPYFVDDPTVFIVLAPGSPGLKDVLLGLLGKVSCRRLSGQR